MTTQEKLDKLQGIFKEFFLDGSPRVYHEGSSQNQCHYCGNLDYEGHRDDCVWLNLYDMAVKAIGPISTQCFDADLIRETKETKRKRFC